MKTRDSERRVEKDGSTTCYPAIVQAQEEKGCDPDVSPSQERSKRAVDMEDVCACHELYNML